MHNTTSQDERPLVFTMKETSKLLGVGVEKVRDAAKAGQIPTVTIGKRMFCPAVALDQLLKGNR
jgi:excisionase family DNA binding protein